MMKKILVLALLMSPSIGWSDNMIYVTGAYKINGQANAAITLTRGETYTFVVAVDVVHPFWIKSVQGVGVANAYNEGVSANGVTSGEIVFTVPSDAPDTLYYNCKNHSTMTGEISIVDPA